MNLLLKYLKPYRPSYTGDEDLQETIADAIETINSTSDRSDVYRRFVEVF